MESTHDPHPLEQQLPQIEEILSAANDFILINDRGNKIGIEEQERQLATEQALLALVRQCENQLNQPEMMQENILPQALAIKKEIQSQREVLLHQREVLLNLHEQLTGIPNKRLGLAKARAAGVKPLNPISDNELRNINSFEYLRFLSTKIPEKYKNVPGFQEILTHCAVPNKYDPRKVYGDYYTVFLRKLNQLLNEYQNAQMNPKDKFKELFLFDDLIPVIYANPNFALERSYGLIEPEIKEMRHTDLKQVEKTVHRKFKQKKEKEERAPRANDDNLPEVVEKSDIVARRKLEEKGNKYSPIKAGSMKSRISSGIGPNYNPMNTTSQPSIVQLPYLQKHEPTPFRFGTQAEVVDGKVGVNAIYKQLLDIQRRQQADDPILSSKEGSKKAPFTTIYFNYLSLVGSNSQIDVYGKNREKEMAQALMALEQDYPNAAIITLPAEGGLMNHHLSHKRSEPFESKNVVFERIFNIAMGDDSTNFKNFMETDPYADYAGDFCISKNVQNWLFGDGQGYDVQNKEYIIRGLLQQAFNEMNIQDTDNLSQADQQAVYFHFIKSTLAQYIILTLEPRWGVNFTCKDAIDRGGVSLAYYHLVKSINEGKPLTQHEFETILHGPATLVKGRTVNDHIHLLWNTIDAYIEAANKKGTPIPEWLPKWRNQHAPPEVLQYHIYNLQEYISTLAEEKTKKLENPQERFKLFGSTYEKIRNESVNIKDDKMRVANKIHTQLVDYLAATPNPREKISIKLALSAEDLNIIKASHVGHPSRLKEIVDGLTKQGATLNVTSEKRMTFDDLKF